MDIGFEPIMITCPLCNQEHSSTSSIETSLYDEDKYYGDLYYCNITSRQFIITRSGIEFAEMN